MKIKLDFVSNSSSTAYIFDVKKNGLTAKEILDELWLDSNFQEALADHFGPNDWNLNPKLPTKKEVLTSFEKQCPVPFPKGENTVIFGDEDNTVVGRVFDYCLREGFEFRNLSIKVLEYLR